LLDPLDDGTACSKICTSFGTVVAGLGVFSLDLSGDVVAFIEVDGEAVILSRFPI
jgi:hypothetical protein